MISGEHEPTAFRPQVPRHLRSKFDVDDLIQEAIARALHARPCFEGRSDAERRAYFARAIESVRDASVRAFDRDKRRVSRERRVPFGLVSDHTSPCSRAARDELWDRLADALAALTEAQRRAIVLHHLEGLPVSQVARRMEASRASVAGLLRRGLAQMRAGLGEGG